MQWPEMRYKERVLAPDIAEDDGKYAIKVLIRLPEGMLHTTDLLGDFPCPVEALRFAFQYGMAHIDHQPLPAPEWTAAEWHDRLQLGV
ncbi:hypothetical protein AWB80_08446 [Caballeronia pedi]|uniref:Uncharacterized protein n=1 Tax=Caballeronia pedi TaxID=1777141 RepID=A0A158E7G3_9BURK|nr:hypothetical protein [Caballeronia pedi]SAL02815.1 hypothetical protein AWB80_08446 [Caballeronia pedi]